MKSMVIMTNMMRRPRKKRKRIAQAKSKLPARRTAMIKVEKRKAVKRPKMAKKIQTWKRRNKAKKRWLNRTNLRATPSSRTHPRPPMMNSLRILRMRRREGPMWRVCSSRALQVGGPKRANRVTPESIFQMPRASARRGSRAIMARLKARLKAKSNTLTTKIWYVNQWYEDTESC